MFEMQSMRHDEAFMPYTQVPHTSHRSQIIQIFFQFFLLSPMMFFSSMGVNHIPIGETTTKSGGAGD